ncbi:hypothetical protein JHK82_042804 [Glycine max]|nr:hypothetical protein JHK86_042826 [Glycine max]KAG5105834.1 hypothetical protein JHK82_042804 [Glycine max]
MTVGNCTAEATTVAEAATTTNEFVSTVIEGPQKVKVGSSDKIVTAKNIIIATGSVPFVHRDLNLKKLEFLHVCAHILARRGSSSLDRLVILEKCPSFLNQAILSDASGTIHMRS